MVERLTLSSAQHGFYSRALHVLRGAFHAVIATREGRIGLTLVIIIALVGIVGPFVAPYDPEQAGEAARALGPSLSHPLGTDTLGRDVLSRVLSGGRNVLVLPLLATLLAFATGGALGMALAYKGGKLDLFGNRVVDIGLGLPPLLVVMILLSGFGTGSVVVVFATGLVFAPRVARVLRGATQSILKHEYVLAARLRGERTTSVVSRELTPNITAPLLVDFALRLTYAILFVAALNFLGLGTQPPQPDWGLMASENGAILTVNPWASLSPAFLIGVLAVGVTFIADGVTQYLGIEIDEGRGRKHT